MAKSKTHICFQVAIVAAVGEKIRFQLSSGEDSSWLACSQWMEPVTNGRLRHEINYQEVSNPLPSSGALLMPFGSTPEIAEELLERLDRSDGELEPELELARQNALRRDQIHHTLEALAGDSHFQQQMLGWLSKAQRGDASRGVWDFFFEFLRVLIQEPIWDDRPRKKPNSSTANPLLGNVYFGAGGEKERDDADDSGSGDIEMDFVRNETNPQGLSNVDAWIDGLLQVEEDSIPDGPASAGSQEQTQGQPILNQPPLMQGLSDPSQPMSWLLPQGIASDAEELRQTHYYQWAAENGVDPSDPLSEALFSKQNTDLMLSQRSQVLASSTNKPARISVGVDARLRENEEEGRKLDKILKNL